MQDASGGFGEGLKHPLEQVQRIGVVGFLREREGLLGCYSRNAVAKSFLACRNVNVQCAVSAACSILMLLAQVFPSSLRVAGCNGKSTMPRRSGTMANRQDNHRG